MCVKKEGKSPNLWVKGIRPKNFRDDRISRPNLKISYYKYTQGFQGKYKKQRNRRYDKFTGWAY